MATGDWVVTNGPIGVQDIEATETGAQRHIYGTIVQAEHDTYGVAEFIYLKGATDTVAGDWVTYATDNWATVRLIPNAIGPVAISMSANTSGLKGWYMIHGKHPTAVSLTSCADNANLWITATSGAVDDTSVTGDLIVNAKAASTSTALSIEAEISRPWVNNNMSAT